MVIFEQRACSVIYNLIKNIDNDKITMLPSNVCPIVITTFLKAKRPFELIDISETTLCIDESIVLDKLSNYPSKYGAILFVRTYGIEDSFDVFFKEVKALADILIIDDYCLSIPSFTNFPNVADVNIYSTRYTKYADIGWGGFAITRDSIQYKRSTLPFNDDCHTQLLEKIDLARDRGNVLEYIDSDWLNTSAPSVTVEAYKSLVLKEIVKAKEIKDRVNAIYTSQLPQNIQLNQKYQNWRFNIIVPEKNDLLKKIFKEELFASSHYLPSTRMFYNWDSKNSDKLYSEVVNLFNDKYFPLQNIPKIIDIINNHVIA